MCGYEVGSSRTVYTGHVITLRTTSARRRRTVAGSPPQRFLTSAEPRLRPHAVQAPDYPTRSAPKSPSQPQSVILHWVRP